MAIRRDDNWMDGLYNKVNNCRLFVFSGPGRIISVGGPEGQDSGLEVGMDRAGGEPSFLK